MSATVSLQPGQEQMPTRRLALAVIALALGGFGIGTTEFVSMGLLPEIASGLSVSIPQAGHVISAYAVGVVVGAPLIAVLAAKAPRRKLLIGLMIAFALGNAASALAPAFGTLILARFAAGLPHGAYFGVASLVAASLVPASRRAQAVGWMMLGLSIANVVGVPAATWLGQGFGWRSAYWSVAVVGVATVFALLRFAPRQQAAAGASVRTELGALRTPQVLLTLLIGVVGFGGLFATYTYIAPTMISVAGLAPGAVPIVLAISGVGMVVGNLVGGRVADRGILRGILIGLISVAVIMAAFTVAVHNVITGTIVVFLSPVAVGILVPALQTRLMDVAGDAQTLAASLNHAALNMANALGAWLGGVVIAAGWGYPSTGWVGFVLALLGVGVFVVSAGADRRSRTRADLPATASDEAYALS